MSWKYRSDEATVTDPIRSEINLGAQVLTAATVLTERSPRVNYLALAAGFDVTLPAPKLGMEFVFIVAIAPTTAYTVTAATADTMSGTVVTAATGAADTEAAATGDVWTFVANTAVIGDRVTVNADGTSWHGFAVSSVATGITITG